METTYVQPPMFKLNAKSGKYKVTKMLAPSDIFDMSKYLLASSIKDKIINNIDSARDYLIAELASEDREVFACFFLNVHLEVISFEKLFYGTVDGASVEPKIIARRALLLNASNVIAVHNHPSGWLRPSTNDEKITLEIGRVLNLIDVKFVDHYIVAGTGVLSFKEFGLGYLFLLN